MTGGDEAGDEDAGPLVLQLAARIGMMQRQVAPKGVRLATHLGSAVSESLLLSITSFTESVVATRKRAVPAVQILDVHDARGYKYALVDIDRLIPDPENPRIPVQESALDTILALVKEDKDGLFTLARDIVEMKGVNPAELLSVTPLSNDMFVVREGNRRIAARRLLRNPEQLKGHVSGSDMTRLRALASDERAKRLPTSTMVVIGDDHEAWVDRRHLGTQGGKGLIPWNTQAKARRGSLRHGSPDRTAALLEGLRRVDAGRFGTLQPPQRTYTTFTRLLDSQHARAHIGIDVNENDQFVLSKGKRSLRLLEEVLRDLRASGPEKLTSRMIHDRRAIAAYLGRLDTRVGALEESSPVVLAESQPGSKAQKQKGTRAAPRPVDALKALARPKGTRPGKLYDELAKARRNDMPNAAIVLTRLLLELTADSYATDHGLATSSDTDSAIEGEVTNFREQLGRAGIKPSKAISNALKILSTQPPNLGRKLEVTIDSLVAKGKLAPKEGSAKKRELATSSVVALLNDAVHRLHNVPSIDRVNHILEIVAPIFNAMEPTE